MHHQQDDSDQTTHRTFTSVASPSIPQPTHGDRAPQAQVLLLHYLGRPSSIVVIGGCDKVVSLRAWDGRVFRIVELVASTKRVEWSGVSSTPSSCHPFLPSPPPPLIPPRVYFRILFFTSLTPLLHNFPQLMHIHSQRYTSTICCSDRVSGRVSTGMWHTNGKVFARPRSEPCSCSVFKPVLPRTRSRMEWW